MAKNNTIVQKFFDLRDELWENEEIESVVFLKHILVYFYEYRNQLNTPKIKIYIPGKYDLVKSDRILFKLGYRRYSIDYLPKGIYPCESTQITFRNTL